MEDELTSAADLASILEQQRAAEAQRRKELEDELALRLQHAPSQIDWTPLATQLDSMYGGDVSKAAASQNTQAKGFQERTDKLFDELVKGGGGKGKDLTDKLINEQGKQSRADRNFARAAENDIKVDFDKTVDRFDKERKVIDSAENAFTQLEEAFTSGDPERVNAALGTYSTFIAGNKGAQSDSDIARQMQPTLEQAYELFKKKFTGKPGTVDPETYSNLLQAVHDTRRNLSRTVSQKVDGLKKVYSAGPRGQGYKAAYQFVADTDNAARNLAMAKRKIEKKAASTPKPAAPAAANKDPLDAMIEELSKK